MCMTPPPLNPSSDDQRSRCDTESATDEPPSDALLRLKERVAAGAYVSDRATEEQNRRAFLRWLIDHGRLRS